MASTMSSFDDSLRPRLAAGVVLSLLAHAGVLAVVVAAPESLSGEPPRVLQAPAVDIPKPPAPMPLGIEESRAVSINWLGFADPTEHHARPAEVEQAELSPLDAGVPEAQAPQPPVALAEPEAETEAEAEPEAETEVLLETAPAEPVVAQEPAASPTEATAPSPGAEAESIPAPSPLAVLEESSAAATEQLFRVVRRATARAQELAEVAERVARQAAEQAKEASAAKAATSAEQAPQAAPTPPAGESPDVNPSPKESDATSLDDVAEWIPGRPASAQGLDITTVRPRWSITTRLSAVPRNPVLRIDFRKNGTVAKAEFLTGQDTGYPDVDGPLLDAIYNWTAKGKALDELPAGDPKAVVSIKMQMVLSSSRGTLRRANPDR